MRASFERLQHTGQPPAEQFPNASRASSAPGGAAPAGACSLARGIETDERARTVTIHLTRPDADFLHKLATAFAFVVPAGSARRARRGGRRRAPARTASRPGTRIEAGPRPQPLLPVRPPLAPRPLASRTGSRSASYNVTKTERQIAAVQRGAADMTVVANPFSTRLTEPHPPAGRQSPGRLHSAPSQITDWMFINVRRRPFDDLRVRQAVNLAIDRPASWSSREDRRSASRPARWCPPASPATRPIARTPPAAERRGWTAPDLRRARRLVAESGRAGERISCACRTSGPAFGRYYARLLDGSASARRCGSRLSRRRHLGPGHAGQTGLVGWGADYLAPSTFLETTSAAAVGGRTSRSSATAGWTA